MRAVQDRRAELGGLDRILAAMGDERATDKNDRGKPVQHAQFTDGVEDIKVVVGLRVVAKRPEARAQARGFGSGGNFGAAFRMARRDQRQ